MVIAIDGPAGVGKSSVGRTIASRLGYSFLNTGQMYRALAWKAIKEGTDVSDESEIARMAGRIKWNFKKISGPAIKISVDGNVLDKELSDEEVGKVSSAVAKMPQVRKFMCSMQRRIGGCGGIVMEGRDIGSNVFPDAEVKIYLDASARARAKRRKMQLLKSGLGADYSRILEFITARDKQDTLRRHNPLVRTKDSFYIDTTKLSKKEVIAKIFRILRNINVKVRNNSARKAAF